VDSMSPPPGSDPLKREPAAAEVPLVLLSGRERHFCTGDGGGLSEGGAVPHPSAAADGSVGSGPVGPATAKIRAPTRSTVYHPIWRGLRACLLPASAPPGLGETPGNPRVAPLPEHQPLHRPDLDRGLWARRIEGWAPKMRSERRCTTRRG
jgi:hypothetical protein